MRAAARRLLDTEEGCPLTVPYLLREAFTLDELRLEDEVRVGTLMAVLMATSAPTIVHPPTSELAHKYRMHSELSALCIAQHLACALQPWDDGWKKRNTETSKQLSDLDVAIGNKAPANLVSRIEEYERLKREYMAERQAAEHKNSAEKSAS